MRKLVNFRKFVSLWKYSYVRNVKLCYFEIAKFIWIWSEVNCNAALIYADSLLTHI